MIEEPAAGARISVQETNRLEAFSDGVFAIAITLLVLELAVPTLTQHVSARALGSALARQWPSYVSFVTSFATILIMWINHHELFRLVERGTTMLLFANGLLLLFVTAVPFPTALVAQYLDTPAAPVAMAVYAGLFALTNLAYNAVWWTIRTGSALDSGVPASVRRTITRNYASGFVPYLVAMGVAFWSAYVSMGICFCLWILWGMTSKSYAYYS